MSNVIRFAPYLRRQKRKAYQRVLRGFLRQHSLMDAVSLTKNVLNTPLRLEAQVIPLRSAA